MNDTRLNVRVDNATKKQAEAVFTALGMNMSTGINIFLAQVARSRSIPFVLELGGDPDEPRMREVVNAKISQKLKKTKRRSKTIGVFVFLCIKFLINV